MSIFIGNKFPRMRDRLIIIILLTFTVKNIAAQKPYLYFNKLTTQNGLSHNKVNCIMQDRRGFIWIGTDDGLNRYDGHNFTIFRHQPNNATTLSGNIITDLLEDEKGILWIATADGGLTRYDYRLAPLQQFKQYKHLPGDSASIPVNIVNAMIQDSYGFLWLASGGKSILRFNKQTGRFEEPVRTGTKNILDLAMDNNGVIWAGRAGGGILKVNTKDLSYQMDKRYYNLYANLPHATVSSVFRDKTGNIWYGSWDKLLFRYNALTKQEEFFGKSKRPYDFPNDDILSFAEDTLGTIWMGGRYNGLTLYDRQHERFYNYQYDVSLDGTVADNHISSVFIDRSGMVWLGTNKGISVYNPSQQPFVQTFLSGKNSNLTIYDFYRDGLDNLWIGTSDGLFMRKQGSDLFTQRKLTYNGASLVISKIFAGEDGTIYLGTSFSLFVYDPVNNTLHLLPNTEKDAVMYKIIDSRVVSLVKDTIDHHPVLIVSPYGHYLSYYDFTDQRWVSRTDTVKKIVERFNLKDNLVRKIYKTRSGKIWLATNRYGLGEWGNQPSPFVNFYGNDPSDTSSLSNNNVYDLAEDGYGNLWVSTYGGGVNYFNTKTGKATHIDVTSNLVEGLEIDGNGSVWMVSNGNLQKYDPVLKTNSNFVLPDLEKSGGISRDIYKDDKGIMYVAGNNYFIQFDPHTIKPVTTQPAVFLTDFKIFNTSYSHLLFSKGIVLRYDQNFFAFEYSAPEFFKGQVDYSFMLAGYDKDWIEAGERNFANYSNLSSGDYTFKARATDRKSNWSGEYASVKITIIPPVWKRWWFYLIAAFIVAAAIYVFYRYRISELLKRQAIRNKIAQDLHDSVGSTLSSISVYSQVAKIQQEKGNYEGLKDVVQRISTTSTDMISEMNDIVWAINPRNDSMEKILERMESFARPLLQTKNIVFDFNYDNGLLQVNLTMEQRKNFYLIFKESVNNVLKYSGAGHLEVTIKLSQHNVILIAKDDGVGFDTAHIKALAAKSLSGNGLGNMKRRGAEMKGECFIESASGKGAVVKLIFPVI
ncbi:MAG: two-component regulator propeller domain-containing protein [Ferruginibacter sp.]